MSLQNYTRNGPQCRVEDPMGKRATHLMCLQHYDFNHFRVPTQCMSSGCCLEGGIKCK